MLSMKKMLVALGVVVLMGAVAEAVPQWVSAGFGSSPGAGHGYRSTAGVTDGTSNTIVTPANIAPRSTPRRLDQEMDHGIARKATTGEHFPEVILAAGRQPAPSGPVPIPWPNSPGSSGAR